MTGETDIPIYARIFGLIGANGAGKSTLLKLVARMALLLPLSAGFHVDEVLVVGDAAFREKSLKSNCAFQSNGITTLYGTHRLAEAEKTCTRAAWLDHGRLRFVGNVQEAVDLYLNRAPTGVFHS